MTPIPARLMLPQALACPHRPRPTERDRTRRAYILEAATSIFAAHGRTRITMRAFATAIAVSPTTIRHHVADLDHLFALTLAKHLDTILAAIGAVPHNRPDVQARRRAEYVRLTRDASQTLTRIHVLWLRERFTLPEDELHPLEQTLALIGALLAGDAGQTALLLLDSPHLDQTQIETMLAAHTRPIAPELPAQSAATQPQASRPDRPSIRALLASTAATPAEKGSSSFLKKRTKKLLRVGRSYNQTLQPPSSRL